MEENEEERKFRIMLTTRIVAYSVAGVAILFILLIMVQFGQGFWLELALNHFPAVIGLPAAAAASFVVVLLLRNTEGPIEFEGLGFKFKGASGPVVLWVFVFLAIAAAIRMLWPLVSN